MKIRELDIEYIECLCETLPRILKKINAEYDKEEYIYSSENRAKFDRLRIEMNKTLMKIKKDIYS